MLAAAAGVNLLLGVAVAGGVVPQASGDVTLASEQAVVASEAAAPANHATSAPPPVETTVPATTTPPATSPPTTEAPVVVASPPVEEEPEVEAPAPRASAPTTQASTLPARTNPSSGEVLGAIRQLSPSSALTPTEAQAREFGHQVCTAFDQGQTFAQVQQAVMAQVATVPLLGLSVTPTTVSNAIGTAVRLFCPGHASKLA